MFIKDTHIRVRYAETDQMGVVYHANYFVWFEVGRTEWFRELNENYRAMEKQGIVLPVVDAQCQFKKPALYDDTIIVRTYLEEIKGIRMTFHYEIIRQEDEELLAVGKTVHAFVDQNKKPIKLKRDFPTLWERLDQTTK